MSDWVEAPEERMYKWAWNPSEGAIAWPVQETNDGLPGHSTMMQHYWGRDLQHGDSTGMAFMRPDGQMEVSFHHFPQQDGVAAIESKLQAMHPDARIVHNMKHFAEWMPDFGETEEEYEPVYKFIWSATDGIIGPWPVEEAWDEPTHDQVMQRELGRKGGPDDYYMYAVEPVSGPVEIETYRTPPPQAWTQAKALFEQMFPDREVVTPPDLAAQYGIEVSFGEDKHEAAARWAQALLNRSGAVYEPVTAPWAERDLEHRLNTVQMPLEGAEKPSKRQRGSTRGQALSQRLRSFWRPEKLAADGADKEGAMVALYPPPALAEKLALSGEDAEPAADLHVTLAYFVDKAADRNDWNAMRQITSDIAQEHGVLAGKIGGVGIFQNDDGDVLWAATNVPGLAEFRHALVEALDEGGFEVSKEHGFTPHMTLKYNWKGKPPRIPDDKVEFSHVYSVVKGDREKHPFEG